MEEMGFVSLKNRDQALKPRHITWRHVGNGIGRGLAVCFAVMIATTLLMCLCLLLSTCAQGKPDTTEYSPDSPDALASNSGHGGSSASNGSGGKGGVGGSTGSGSGGMNGNGGSSGLIGSGGGGTFATGGSGGSASSTCEPGGIETCNGLDDDCDGLTDCQDPDCAAMSACASSNAGNCSGQVAIHLQYQGPAWPGINSLDAWWMPPGEPPRSWGPVDECADTLANDGKLDCVFHVPHCAASLEFQINLPYNRFWGDMSCSVNGGCGNTIGSVILDIQGIQLSYTLKSNGDKDPNCSGGCDPYPYKNGLVDFVP